MNLSGIRYATAQLIAHRDGKTYLEQIPGIPVEIALPDGRVLKNVKAKGSGTPVWGDIYLLSPSEAAHLFLNEPATPPITPKIPTSLTPIITKLTEAGAPHAITIGVNKAAEAPADSCFARAAVYRIDNLPAPELRAGKLLNIPYRGDVARLYCDGHLIADNFYNGRPMLFGLWRLPAEATSLELRVLPLQPDLPVYFAADAVTTAG